MLTLQPLRNAHHLTRLVLVWFALFIGLAVASPLVNPQGVQEVCTTAGTSSGFSSMPMARKPKASNSACIARCACL